MSQLRHYLNALYRRFSGRRIAALALAALTVLPAGAASAATGGATVTSLNMRAGPGTWYPVVITMPPNAALTVFGCLNSGSWCDVSWGGARGWVAANYIYTTYEGRTVALNPAIIPAVGLAVVAFNQAYWNNYYASKPWYGQWGTYYGGPAGVARQAGVVRGPYGGAAAARGGCVGAACGGTAVMRGPAGGGFAGRGGCGPNYCGGAGVTRQPGGELQFRRGVIER